jgi:hypothetical protein
MIQDHMMTAAAAGWTSLARVVSPETISPMTIVTEKATKKREIAILIQSNGVLTPWECEVSVPDMMNYLDGVFVFYCKNKDSIGVGSN